jgi:hypothetical protein
MMTYTECDAIATLDLPVAPVGKFQRHSKPYRRPQEEALYRYRVTALLDSGASIDCGVQLGSSVPEFIRQAKQTLRPEELSEVINWRVEVAKDELPPAFDALR